MDNKVQVLAQYNGRNILYFSKWGDTFFEFPSGSKYYLHDTDCCGVGEFSGFQVQGGGNVGELSVLFKNFNKIEYPPVAGVIVNIVHEWKHSDKLVEALTEGGWVCSMTPRRNPNSGNTISSWMFSFDPLVLEAMNDEDEEGDGDDDHYF